MKQLQVAAAILKNERNEILICRRLPNAKNGGLWEFPGGKMEPGESPEECAVRECREELSVEIRLTGRFGTAHYRYPDSEIDFVFFTGVIESGSIVRRVHQEICWVSPRELKNFPFCPADEPIVKRLATWEQGDEADDFIKIEPEKTREKHMCE